MKHAEDLKRISTNVIKQREKQEEELYLNIIFSKWFLDIIKDIEEKAVLIAKTGEQEYLIEQYKIDPQNEELLSLLPHSLSFKLDLLHYVFSRYFSDLGYDSWVKIRPVYNMNNELIACLFTGKIFW